MKINFTDPLPPAHPYYEPTSEFIERHGLHIDEAEVWVTLYDIEGWHKATRSITFSKDSGELFLSLHERNSPSDEPVEKVLFVGYLPNEAALEDVIRYTNWEA